jgi:phosphoribosyl 1,2-cyclic phosphodiesterase
VKVRLWGTRGSVATPGPETMRYGGNTACVEVRNDDGTLLVLDAGTGVRRLGATVEAGIQRVDLLLTHLHMDHIQGLGFFEPLFRPGLEVHIWGPSTTTLDLRAHLNRYLSPPLFPVRLRELPCRLTLHDAVATPRFEIDGVSVEAMLVSHPGATVGFRIEADGASLAYIPDHEPALGTGRVPDHPAWISGLALARGVDLLIHDAQYTAAEYPEHVGWGHSSIPQALSFASAARVGKLVAFHHDPAHSDAMLDRVYEEVRSQDLAFEVQCAAEGDVFKLGGRAGR